MLNFDFKLDQWSNKRNLKANDDRNEHNYPKGVVLHH